MTAILHLPSAAVGVDAEVGVDEVPAIAEQPRNAVGVAAFLVLGQGDDDVAVGREPFLFEPDECRDQGSGLVLYVGRSAAVEVAVTLEEREGVERPVLAKGLDDVEVADEEDGAEGAVAAVADYQVHVLRLRPDELNVVLREAGRPEPRGHCLGRFRAAHGERRVDLDQLAEDVAAGALMVRELRGASGRLGADGHRSGHCSREHEACSGHQEPLHQILLVKRTDTQHDHTRSVEGRRQRISKCRKGSDHGESFETRTKAFVKRPLLS